MEEKIKKLPKWVQEHIQDLQRERDVAVRALNEHLDNQIESPFYFDDRLCIGEKRGHSTKRFYIQTHKMTIVSKEVQLDVLVREYDNVISLSWEPSNCTLGEVAFIPTGHQQARLVSKANMR